ncbi:MAG TPA: hypothetical protein VK066_15635 [Chloroflexota bacterium]|nr:hypothetical protein [Chloroflexota bacterium]
MLPPHGGAGGRPGGDGARGLGLLLGAVLVIGLAWGALGAPPAVGQDDVPAAGPPLSLSGRLRAQGHDVAPDEAVYLDADEEVTEQYVRLLVVVQDLSQMLPTTEGWRPALIANLQAMAQLEPTLAPVPPPEGLRDVHAQSVAYREHLGKAADAWLAAVQADDPTWLLRGTDEYAAAEQARLAWYQALYEYYTGEPAPNALPRQ